MTIETPATASLTAVEADMVARLITGPYASATRDDLLNALGRERRFGLLIDGEVAESARLKLIAAWGAPA